MRRHGRDARGEREARVRSDIEEALRGLGLAREPVCVHASLRSRMTSGAPVQGMMKRAIRKGPPGPTPEQRAKGVSLLWGKVEDAEGRRAVSRLRTPEGYTLTARTSVEAVRRVLAGDAPAGFQTPSRAYGPDWITEFEGVVREEVE